MWAKLGFVLSPNALSLNESCRCQAYVFLCPDRMYRNSTKGGSGTKQADVSIWTVPSWVSCLSLHLPNLTRFVLAVVTCHALCFILKKTRHTIHDFGLVADRTFSCQCHTSGRIYVSVWTVPSRVHA